MSYGKVNIQKTCFGFRYPDCENRIYDTGKKTYNDAVSHVQNLMLKPNLILKPKKVEIVKFTLMSEYDYEEEEQIYVDEILQVWEIIILDVCDDWKEALTRKKVSDAEI